MSMLAQYLEAKRTIDDRSLNPRVWRAFGDALAGRPEPELRIAEIGAGTGTMIDRMREWGLLRRLRDAGRRLSYTAWEREPAHADILRRRAAAAEEFDRCDVRTEDVFRADDAASEFDAVVAHAVLDLFQPQQAVEMFRRKLRPGGLVYASIVFDGVTDFSPEIDPFLDSAIIELYHRSMSGGLARRHLVELTQHGFEVIEAGSSDWIVPPRSGGPQADERVLVSTVLEMLERSVGEQLSRDPGRSVGTRELDRWVSERRRRLADGALLFTAHQIDFVVRRGE